jgi:16S rRNA (adenine1518-N6/adenine1519-N6)-dimethyltransferase
LSHQPRKRFGQNFLHDPGVIGRIVTAINPKPDESLVEIGPGQGAITLPLLKVAGKLTVIELDRDLIQPLEESCRGIGELTVHNTDALQLDFCSLAYNTPLRVVGNLPYNISTPLLFHLLDQHRCIRDMHFMLQKEVVERMAATPCSGHHCLPSAPVHLDRHPKSTPPLCAWSRI